ncbi:hypothetical protein [Micromonospora orduensis]|uniref:hypothetical protein n=1 Tax=Micromonospora orduensis TaxID=1420891 RepID=UPI0033E9555D
MAREFGSDSPQRRGAWRHHHVEGANPEDATEESEDDGGSEWWTVSEIIRDLRDETLGLEQAHAAAVELDELVTAYGGGKLRTNGPTSVILLRAVTLNLIAVLEDADLPDNQLRQLEPLIDSLASQVGADLPGADTGGPQTSVWLDVASPAHGYVNVSGVLTAFSKGHVTTADSASVITANDCTLEAEEHYHLSRVSLDCRSLYDDEEAMKAFVHALLDPSPRNISRLFAQLERIIDLSPDAETQLYRHRLPACVTARTERAAVVAMGAASVAHTTSIYRVRETVIPLAELLLRQPRLIYDLATRFDGDTLDEPLLTALGKVKDSVLLRNATDLPAVRTSVSYSLGGTRVRMANAVMVGHGNTLVAIRKVKRGRSRTGSLVRLDREVQRTKNAMREWPEPPQPSDMPHQPELSPSSPPLSVPRFPLLHASPTQPAEEGKKCHNLLSEINDKLGPTKDRNMRRDVGIDRPHLEF